ncbi:MAG: YHS domain-containing protein, partial [Candidatus Thorarchaeota archaeon]|nr:YHS domain-containing protein [Candidatus Thorarchaeota archaeon]
SSVSVITNALSLNRFKPEKADVFDTGVPPAAYQEGDVAVDPICKMKVEIATADLYSDYQGKRYYFCNQYCLDTFNADPEQYKEDYASEVVIPDVAIDPICKMDVVTASAELHSDLEGKRYYFCAPYCKETFDADPATYKDQDFRE